MSPVLYTRQRIITQEKKDVVDLRVSHGRDTSKKIRKMRLHNEAKVKAY